MEAPPLAPESWHAISRLIEDKDPHCRGILLLGLDAPEEKLKAGFTAAAKVPWVKGFAVGRTIFGQPSRRWLQGELDDETLVEQVKNNYLKLIDYWRAARSAL